MTIEIAKSFVAKNVWSWIMFGHIAKGDHLNGNREDMQNRIRWEHLNYASTLLVDDINGLCEYLIETIDYKKLQVWASTNIQTPLKMKVNIPDSADYWKLNSNGESVEATKILLVFGKREESFCMFDMYPI